MEAQTEKLKNDHKQALEAQETQHTSELKAIKQDHEKRLNKVEADYIKEKQDKSKTVEELNVLKKEIEPFKEQIKRLKELSKQAEYHESKEFKLRSSNPNSRAGSFIPSLDQLVKMTIGQVKQHKIKSIEGYESQSGGLYNLVFIFTDSSRSPQDDLYSS